MATKRRFPAKLNGIVYKSQEELDERIKSDAMQLAELIYDIYLKQKGKE